MKFTKHLVFSLVAFVFVLLLSGCGESYEQPPQITGTVRPPVLVEKAKAVRVEPRYDIGSYKSLAGKTIVIDAGHGGKDPGAGEVGYSRVPEKHIVLAIAKEIEAELKSKGARTIMTRHNDNFVELDARAATADRFGADLLVSIHADSAPGKDASGATLYIARIPSWQTRKIARTIDTSLKKNGINSRGIRGADFRVLVKHSKPAVLVECGYLTDRIDAQRLNSNWYRKKIAAAISEGIADSLGTGSYAVGK